MLSNQQQKVLVKLIADTVNKIRNIYNEKLPLKADAAEVVSSLLNYLSDINHPNEIQMVIDDYPDAEKQIRILGNLRFPDQALSTLNLHGKFLRHSDRPQGKTSNQDISNQTKQELSKHLLFQKQTIIPSAKMSDSITAKTKIVEKEIYKTEQKLDELSAKDEEISEKTEKLKREIEIQQESSAAAQKKLNITKGVIYPADWEEWINKSSFKVDLESVQKTINRLDSIFVYGGKAKAAKLKAAFKNALDAGVQGKIRTFDDFLNYKKSGQSLFKNEPSLQEVLDDHRLKLWDSLIGKNTTKGLIKK